MWPSLLAGVLLVLISPVYGLYAFLGYIEAPIVSRGTQHWVAMVITAAACAYAQIGGPASPLWSSPLYALFFAVNAKAGGLGPGFGPDLRAGARVRGRGRFPVRGD